MLNFADLFELIVECVLILKSGKFGVDPSWLELVL